MYYREVSLEQIPQAVWDVESTVRCVAGANLDTSNLPAGAKRILKGTPLTIDKSTRKVKAVKTAKVAADAAANATTISVEKGSMLVVGDTIAGSKITAINDSAADKDVLTVAALGKALKKGDVIDDGNGKNVIGLAYTTTPIEDFTSVTWTIQAYEIQEDTLPYPLNDDIKNALTSRHHFAAF